MTEIKMLLSLIRCSLGKQESLEYVDSIDVQKLIYMIKGQNLVPMIYPVLVSRKDERWHKVADLLKETYNRLIYKSLMQQIEVESFLTEMEKHGNACLPLKGWMMREYYPDPSYRTMTDFDVLVGNYDRKTYEVFMKQLGLELYEVTEGQHDVYVKKPYVVMELHFSLSSYALENEVPQIDRWLDKLWEKSVPKQDFSSIHMLKDEDFYLYHLVHLYKHIRSSGCGIRPLIDIAVFLNKKENGLDWNSIRKCLTELHLVNFEECMRTLSDKCFRMDGAELNQNDAKLLDFILGKKSYTGKAAEAAGRIAKAKGKTTFGKKLSMIWSVVFLPRNEMTLRFNILKKIPFLLPFFWVIRIFKMAFNGKIGAFIKGSSKEVYEEVAEIHRLAGIEE